MVLLTMPIQAMIILPRRPLPLVIVKGRIGKEKNQERRQRNFHTVFLANTSNTYETIGENDLLRVHTIVVTSMYNFFSDRCSVPMTSS